MSILIIPLVGSHYNPPAKALLEHLPNGAKLRLRRDTENPYDEFAIEVFVEGSAIPESQHREVEVKVAGFGHSLEEIIAPGASWKLGHLGASGGKPLAKMQQVRSDLVGNRELLNAAPAGVDGLTAKLVFDGAGLQLVEVEVQDLSLPPVEGDNSGVGE